MRLHKTCPITPDLCLDLSKNYTLASLVLMRKNDLAH